MSNEFLLSQEVRRGRRCVADVLTAVLVYPTRESQAGSQSAPAPLALGLTTTVRDTGASASDDEARTECASHSSTSVLLAPHTRSPAHLLPAAAAAAAGYFFSVPAL